MEINWRNIQLDLKTVYLSFFDINDKVDKFENELNSELTKFYKYKKKCRFLTENNLKFLGIDTTNKPKNKIKISICKNEDLQFYSSIKRYLLEFRNNNKLLIKLINSLNKEEETKIAKILCHFFFEDITQNECSPIFIKFIKNLIQNGFKNLDLNISDSFFEKHTFLSKIFDEIIYRKEIKLYTKHILTDIIKLLKKEEEKLIKNDIENEIIFLTLDLENLIKIIKIYKINEKQKKLNNESQINKSVTQNFNDFQKFRSFTLATNKNQILNNHINNHIKNNNNNNHINNNNNNNNNNNINNNNNNINNINNNKKNDEEKFEEEEENFLLSLKKNGIELEYLRQKLRKETNLMYKKFYIKQLKYIQKFKRKNIFSNNEIISLLKNKKILKLYKENFDLLKNSIDIIIKNLKNTEYYIPIIIKEISKIINNEMINKYPEINKFDLNNFILYFFIEYIIIPNLLYPEINEKITKKILSVNSHKSLFTIVKILRKISKAEFFSNEIDLFYTPLNQFMENWIFSLYDLVTSITSNKKSNDLFDYNNENENNYLDLYQTFCLSKSEIKIFLDKYKKIDYFSKNYYNAEYDQLMNHINLFNSENNLKNDKNINKNFFVFINKNYPEERLQNLKIKQENEIYIEHTENDEYNKNNKKNFIQGIKNSIKHIFLNIPNINENLKNENFDNLFLKINLYIQYQKKDFNSNMLNDIPLSWYSNYIYNNLNYLPNEYKENNYKLLHDEIIKETNNLKEKLNKKNMILCTSILSEINLLKKNVNFYIKEFQEIKELKLNIQILYFIENMNKEIFFYNLKENNFNDKINGKLFKSQIFDNENEKEEIIIKKFVYNNIENDFPNLLFETSKNQNKIQKYICNNINKFISKLLKEKKNSIISNIINKYKNRKNKKYVNKHEFNVNDVIQQYCSIISEDLNLNKFNYFFEGKNMKEKKNDFMKKIFEYIITKIIIKIDFEIKKYINLIEIKELSNDILFHDKCNQLLSNKEQLKSELKIEEKYLIKNCIENAKKYIKKIDDEKYYLNIIGNFTKALNIIVDMVKFSNNKSQISLDEFLPIMIYIIIESHPKNMISNLSNCIYFLTKIECNQTVGFNLANLESCVNYIINYKEEKTEKK